MGNVMSKSRRTRNNTKVIKRTIKFLSVAPDSEVVRSVLLHAPDGVVRAISNAALNAREGDVRIPPHLKRVFAKYHGHIDRLIDRRRPLTDKRRILVQRGGVLPIIAPLIATVLGSIGGEFISRIFRRNDE